MSIYDMLLSNAMLGEGGGGGSSDLPFNTAQVTVNMAENEWSSWGKLQLNPDEDYEYRYHGFFAYPDGTFSYDSIETEPNTSTITTLIFSDDSVVASPTMHIASVSGNAVISEDDYGVVISGDCTINLDGNWS